MAMSISEHARMMASEARVAVLEQQMTALALELSEALYRIAVIEARKKPGPKPKADNATEAAD